MENTQSIPQEEITLDNLRDGKFTIKDIPRPEVDRLWKEEYQQLPEGAKQVADSVNWKPKHFFLGKKKDGSDLPFKDWEEFAEDVRTKLPVVNERLRNVTKEKLEADAKIEKLERQIAQMTAMQKMQMEKELRKEKAAVDHEIREAKEYQDLEKYEAARERKAQVELEEKALKQFEEEPIPKAPVLSPEIILFKANNPWFEKDKKMTNYARGYDDELRAKYPNLSLAERFRMVEDDVKAEFPEKFVTKEDSAPQAPAVESGRNSGRLAMPRGNGDLTFGQLSTHEQGEIERLMKHGIFTSKAEAMKEYNARKK